MASDDKQHEATTEFNGALKAAFDEGKFEDLGGFYTEDTILLPPRGKMLEGRAPVTALWRGVKSRFAGMVFTTATVKDLGEAAKRETGTYTTVPLEAGGNAPEGKYIFVWQLVDGEWQIESSIWNRSSGPAQGEGRRGAGAGQRGGAGQGGGQRRQGGGQGGGGQGGGYGQGGGNRQGGYRQNGGGGYRQGGQRPSFQGGGGGIGGGGGGQRRGGPGGGQRRGGGQGGGQGGGRAAGSAYDQGSGLYSDLKD